MDKILLNQLSFYGYHGLFQEEKNLGQRFIIDAVLDVPLNQAGKTDDMNQSIDYGAAYTVIEQIVTGESKKLIEAVAEDITVALLGRFPSLESCTIKVIKPDPPIPGQYESVAVQIYRERSDL